MTDEVIVHEYRQVSFERPMVIVGFPSAGLIGPIAASFIVKSLKLDKIAAVLSDGFPPYAVIHEGVASPPVRIYSGHRVCDEHGERCEQVIVITCEFMPSSGLTRPMAEAILDWCKSNDANTIVSLEGMNVGENPEGKEVLAVATGDRCRQMIATYGLKELREGMVSGLSGVLLYEGERKEMDVICLLGPARLDLPDARGAARLLEYVARMLPELRIDPEPLYKEAETLEKEMKTAMEAIRRQAKPPEESVLYG
ncbi:MAG: PAC2 family protein [Methanomassiliicoccales archaeon]|nr:PAC2 family protein [Methanomassiliicoccales archaeon]